MTCPFPTLVSLSDNSNLWHNADLLTIKGTSPSMNPSPPPQLLRLRLSADMPCVSVTELTSGHPAC